MRMTEGQKARDYVQEERGGRKRVRGKLRLGPQDMPGGLVRSNTWRRRESLTNNNMAFVIINMSYKVLKNKKFVLLLFKTITLVKFNPPMIKFKKKESTVNSD